MAYPKCILTQLTATWYKQEYAAIDDVLLDSVVTQFLILLLQEARQSERSTKALCWPPTKQCSGRQQMFCSCYSGTQNPSSARSRWPQLPLLATTAAALHLQRRQLQLPWGS